MNLRKAAVGAGVAGGLLLALCLYAVFFRAYRQEPLNRIRIAPKPPDQRAALSAAARSMKGVLYDQSMGGFGNFFGRLGFPVCIDVPRVAYAAAGVDLDALLRQDYKVHAKFYNTEGGRNLPDTEFFVRRVRNLNSYCRANNKFLPATDRVKTGDLVMN
ncbi:MAG TPA: DUF1287 domain-containing protein, partial [Elusimicrobiales bacterium]|nr:DUF1287 domain-containing protein [Elusimicrobiales bacterium]